MSLTLAALVLAAAPSRIAPQAEPPRPKPTLKRSDYDKWEALGGGFISDDGKWHACTITRGNGSTEGQLRAIDGPERWVVPQGRGPQFADGSAHAAFLVVPSSEEADQLRQQGRRIEPRLVVRTLATGQDTVYSKAARWAFLKGGGHLVVQHMGPAPVPGQPPGPPSPPAGSDLQVVDLKTMQTTVVAGVAEFLPHDSGMIALRLASAAGQKGVQVLNPATREIRTLAWGDAEIRGLTWAEKAPVLAWMEARPSPAKEGDNHLVKLVRNPAGESSTTVLDPEKQAGIPQGHRVNELAGLSLNKDGTIALFGVREWKDRRRPEERPKPSSNVEIWSTKDVDVMPLQRSTAEQERRRTPLAAWRPATGSLVVFSKAEDDAVRAFAEGAYAVALDVKRWGNPVKENGLEHVDVVLLDTATGARKVIWEKAVGNVGQLGASTLAPSPKGRYLSWFDKGKWQVFEPATGKAMTISDEIKDELSDLDDDRTLPERGPWAGPVWLKDDKGVVLYGKHDAHLVDMASSRAVRLTSGAKENLQMRLVDLDQDEEALDPKDGLYFRAFDMVDKGSGLVHRQPNGETKTLIFDNKMVSGFRRSKNTDRVLFRMQAFHESPNDFVTNLQFSAAKPVTKTNPQQEQFAWGRTELVKYKALGQDLQATLIYPANYVPGRFYPMVVDIYEKQSDFLHGYRVPRRENYYNTQHFVQNGYFVLEPDIVYKRRQPGTSAVECVEAAVRASISKRAGIDPAKVGLMGHSWGAYQAVFIATQSRLFRAYVAGAPLTELITMYSGFYWNWGQANQVIFESSQGRLDVPWWRDLRAWTANSPLYHAEKITAPMLVEAGTVDGAVDWTQSQFLYTTLRRMGKDMTLLVYPNENHGLGQPANQVDYALRMQHFFDVHLKGAKADSWLASGVRYVDLDEERKRTRE